MIIAVFCGSDFGTVSAYTEMAREIGKWIGQSRNTLIYGGGEAGLMGTVAEEVHNAGCEVIGVVPGNVDFIKDRPQPFVTELIVSKNMSERKEYMFENADVFIALPGGIGTLDEISEAATLTKIGVFNKPCILINKNGFYNPIMDMFSKMTDAGFLLEESMKHVLFSDDIKEIDSFIRNYFK